jgi:integrase
MKVKYTIPKISKTTHLWFVHFRYDGKQFRYSLHYNKIENLKERQIYFEELCKEILKDLKAGWNPNIKEVKVVDNEITVNDAFDLALATKKEIIQNDTYIVLKSKVNRFKKIAKVLRLDQVKITELKNRHYELILNKTAAEYKLSDTSYNTYKIGLANVLNCLVDLHILKRNFKLKVKSKKVNKLQAHVPASENNITIIKQHLQTNFPDFYLFWVTLFHTGARPTELLKVKLFMIDLSNDSINMDKDITKNGKPRIIPINQYLKIILIRLNIENLPKDYYLFGKDFKPSIKGNERKQATTLWKEEIKDKLGINATLYSIKKHSANSLILAGVSINAIKDLFGHTSEVTTQIYITNLKEVNRKEILEKGTEF